MECNLNLSRLSRLFQPGKPLFWVMVVLNALSAVLLWLFYNWPLTVFGQWLIAVLALGNAGLGGLCAWRLLKDDA